MTALSIDIETYSEISLPDCGVYKYTDSPSFEILLFAYSIDDEPVKIIDLVSGEKIPKDITKLIYDKNVIKTAFNAQFERTCLSKHFNKYIEPESWSCTMVKALTLGLPGSLDNVSKVLGLTQDKQKLSSGKSLIRLFSIPCKPSKANNFITRYSHLDKIDEWQRFKDYCIRDVEAEKEIRKRLDKYTTTETEEKLWYLDQRINDLGVRLDYEFVKQAIKMDEQYAEGLAESFKKVTGLDNHKSVAQLKSWVNERLKTNVESLSKEIIPVLIEIAGDNQEVRKALEIRQEIAKTSVTKYRKMEDVICSDSRAKGLLQFYGANRTGRFAGRLIQVQNLPQNKISDLGLARQVVKSGDLELLQMLYGKVPNILSQLIRTAFIPSEGCRFIVSDFSAIEARVIAWLSGEVWRMEVFRTHGKIYEASASQMFKVPIESIGKGNPLRQKGKVAELALGYQGGTGALIQMGALKMGLAEEELSELVKQWRAANSKIIRFWVDVEYAAKEAIKNKTTVELQHGIRFIYSPGVLFIQLPSGRRLAYQNPQLKNSKITYDGMEQTTNTWRTLDTYGGKLVENIVQATARDCLAEAMLRLDEAGYKIVMHVHDEVVLDVPNGFGSLDKIAEIMGKAIDWAAGLPLRADGYECDYYKKD